MTEATLFSIFVFRSHYSGHGGQTADLDGDEDDGNDESEFLNPVSRLREGNDESSSRPLISSTLFTSPLSPRLFVLR